MTGKRSQTWFAQLRRDGAAFALACTLILVANLFQPLAQAQAAEHGSWGICATHGVDASDASRGTGDAPAHKQDCPLCVAGNHCGSLSAPKLVAAIEVAYAPPAALARPSLMLEPAIRPSGLPAGSPPAIRAPPSFA